MIALLKKHLPFLQDSTIIEQIHKGYSTDTKYFVLKSNQPYILRTFDSERLDSKQEEYEILKQMQVYEVNCSRPIEFGHLEALKTGYMILSYIDGEDASEVLPKLTYAEQYQIGLEAGQQLFNMHQLHAPASTSSWYERKLTKYQRHIEQYKQLEVKIQNDASILSFIEKHLHLMKDRPNIFQHDDFHVANLIVKDNKLSGVIDFNRYDWGDPIHEFLKVGFFSSEFSIPFSIGQIKGYHLKHEPDEHFWQLYSLYLAMSIVVSVVWILKVKPEELNIMMNKINRVLEDHDYFERVIPKWYI